MKKLSLDTKVKVDEKEKLKNKKIKLEVDNGQIILKDPEAEALHIIQIMKRDNVNMRSAWKYIDSSNRYYRISPNNKEAMGRAGYNQLIFDIIKKKFKKI